MLIIDRDIVDHKSSSNGIWHVLVGSLEFSNDKVPDNVVRDGSSSNYSIAKCEDDTF